ncbi:hypothetical protein ACMHYO_11990 [Allopusillimonas ginsengisoli]|uniref:hypothetical protein n=1 Tax=Allopusillimonas ginsengisoli TaxID=453575 RepID=UPI0039C42845
MANDSIYQRLRRAGNGMINTFQFFGPLLAVDYAAGTFDLGLHPKDSRRRVTMPLGRIVIPRSIQIGQQILVNGYVRATMENGARELRFHPIAVRDCLDLSHFNSVAQREWKEALGLAAPKAAGETSTEEKPYRVDDQTFHAIRNNFYGRGHVSLEGFIEALYMDKGKVIDGAAPTPPCLHILLRQFENADLSIPLRLYGRSLEAKSSMQAIMELFNQSRKRGRLFPVRATGRAEVDIKDMPIESTEQKEGGQPDMITKVVPIIKVERLRMLSPDEFLRFIPHEEMDRATGETKMVDYYPWANIKAQDEPSSGPQSSGQGPDEADQKAQEAAEQN